MESPKPVDIDVRRRKNGHGNDDTYIIDNCPKKVAEGAKDTSVYDTQCGTCPHLTRYISDVRIRCQYSKDKYNESIRTAAGNLFIVENPLDY